MLGFNKYVVPFQKELQTLPFNVAGLETVKYTNANFAQKAALALDTAIIASRQDTPPAVVPDQMLEAFLLAQRLLVVHINTDGNRNIYNMGRPLGFNLLMAFDGMRYTFFGNFTSLLTLRAAARVNWTPTL